MSDITPMNVDFGLLGPPPDPIGDYTNAFKVGQDLARQGAMDKAGATNALTGRATTDPALAARIPAVSPTDREGADRRADVLAAVGLGLKGLPYAERAGVLAHMAPALAALGAPPAEIAAFDPTDEALDAAVASARSLQDRLAPAG